MYQFSPLNQPSCVGIFAVLSSLLMPVLLVALILCPVVNAITSLTDPEAITDMIGKIDIRDLTSADPAIEMAIEKLDIPVDAIDDLLGMQLVEDFTRLYLEDAEAQLFEGQRGTRITEEKLLSILDDNMDDIVEYIREYSPKDTKDSSDAEIADEIRSLAKEKAPELVDALPPVSDIIDGISDAGIDTEIITRSYDFIKNTLMPLTYTVIVLLSLLIFGCRAYHLEGTIWLGIDYFLASIALFVVTLVSDGILSVIALAGVGSSLSGILSNTVGPFAVTCLLIGIAFIGAFIAIRIFLSKRKKQRIAAQNEQAYLRYQQSIAGAEAQNAM